MKSSMGWWTAAAVIGLLAGPGWVRAQVLQGTVLDEEAGRPVPAVLVALQDANGRQRAASLSDSLGFYRLNAPGAGDYYLVAEGLGIDVFRSHLLAVAARDEAYGLDILVRRVPVPIQGIEVTVEQRLALERSLRHLIGVSPGSLRVRPIHRDEILRQAARGNGLVELLREWGGPSVVVMRTVDGPCFNLRGRCVPVYLNDARIPRGFGDAVPVELAGVVLVLLPGESVRYPGGGVFLYTSGWIR
ncbi:MAG: carboxypeptidase regulatory-like domain-containing protein [Gemmatimonadales bacterium]|jgi:hypothetical protein|nr:MAG: carboxypeptidase regulatory-like domain-containing protein [Gemmatimonadales bacterium]